MTIQISLSSIYRKAWQHWVNTVQQMRRLFSSTLAITFLLMGGGIVKADDYDIESGTTFTLSDYGSSYFSSSGSIWTLIQDLDCDNNTAYDGGIAEEACRILNTSNTKTNASNISTNTSNININKSNINNLGEGVANATALTAALTALPQSSPDSKLSCGIGTGTYSSSYAVGLGCASKVNERVDVNFGGSYVGGGSKDYGSGSLDNVAAKAGIAWKLGQINKPRTLSMSDKNTIQTETLQKIKKENEEIKKVNSELMTRLEQLEGLLSKLREALTY